MKVQWQVSPQSRVVSAKLRSGTDRDYRELKQELWLDRYKDGVGEVITRRMAPSVAAYGFIVSERRLIPRSTKPRLSRSLAYPRVIDHADPG